MLALVAGILSIVSGRMTKTAVAGSPNSNPVLRELSNHLVYLGASLSTTIVSTFLGNYSSALLTEVRATPKAYSALTHLPQQQLDSMAMKVAVLVVAATLVFAIKTVLIRSQ